jgi:hypothetical protein
MIASKSLPSSFSSFFLLGLLSIILSSQVILTRADIDPTSYWDRSESGSGSWEEGHSNIECPLWHNGTEPGGAILWYHHPMKADVSSSFSHFSFLILYSLFFVSFTSCSLVSQKSISSFQKLKGCPQFSSSSCCTEAYGGRIQAHNDWIGSAFKNHVQLPLKNEECGATLKSAQCLLCSPAQEQYVTFHSYGQTLHLCEDFCEKLLYDCRDEIWAATNETVSQMYSLIAGAGDDFCHDIWTGNQLTHAPNPHWAYVDVRDVDCHVDKRKMIFFSFHLHSPNVLFYCCSMHACRLRRFLHSLRGRCTKRHLVPQGRC